MYLLNNGMVPGIPISQLPQITNNTNLSLELNGSEQLAIARDTITYNTDIQEVGDYYYVSLGIDNLAALSGGWQDTFITVSNRSFFWDSVYSSVAATSSQWDSVYSTVNTLSDFWDGDFCNETVYLSTVSACNGAPIDMSNSSIGNINSLTATEIHSVSSFTHYQDILISELSGFEVGGSVEVAEKVTVGSLQRGAEALNVQGNVQVDVGWVGLSGVENGGLGFLTRDGTAGGIGLAGASNKLIENDGDGADLYVNSAGDAVTRGNLSVNTDQTISKVTVKGGDIAIDTNGNNNWGYIGQGPAGSGIGLRGAGASSLTESHLYVAQGGNVGIGTETPSNKLFIKGGTIKITDDPGTSAVSIRDVGTIELAKDGGGALIDFKAALGTDFDSRIVSNANNNLDFFTGGDGNTQRSLRITPDGDAIVTGVLSASCGNSEEWCDTTTVVQTSSAVWEKSTSVNVSATAPAQEDLTNGDLWFDSTNGDLFMYYVDEDESSSQWVDINALGGAGSVYCDTTLFLNQVSACNGEMFIEGTVNVDGHVDSNASISTRGTGTSTRLLPDGRIELRKDGGTPVIDFKSSANNYDTRIKSTTTGKLAFDVGGDGSIISNALVISSNGNIGIGELNPQNKLQIQDGDIALLGATIGGAGFITQDGTIGGIGICGNSSRLIKSGGVGADLYVTDGGVTYTRGSLTVGGNIIGTGNMSLSGGSTPASGFNLNSNVGGLEIIDAQGTDNPYIDFKTSRSEGHDTRIIQKDNGLAFVTGGDPVATQRMIISDSGEVGINVLDPLEQLHVKGNIMVGEKVADATGLLPNHNYIRFAGTYADTGAFIGERRYDGTVQKSELIIFNGNDNGILAPSTGPDRVRIASGEFRFDTIGDSGITDGMTPDEVLTNGIFTNRFIIDADGRVGIGNETPQSNGILTTEGNIYVASTIAGGDGGFITANGTGSPGGFENKGIGLVGNQNRLADNGGVGADFYVTDTGKSVVRNALVLKGNAQPITPDEGTIYFDNVTKEFRGWDGTTWVLLG